MAAYRRVDDLLSPAGWLPVHRRVWEAFTFTFVRTLPGCSHLQLNSCADGKQVICYSCICTAVNSQGWHCHNCMLSNLPCSCIWSAPYLLQTLQEVLPILVPTTLALWSSDSSLEMASSAAFEYWLSRFLPETLHSGYVAVQHVGWVAVFPLHDFCSRIALVLFDWWRSKDWLCYRGWLSVFPASGTGQSQRPTTGTDVSPYEQRPLWHLRMRARLAKRTFWLRHWMRRWCYTQNTHENGQCSWLALSKACADNINVIKS